MEFQNKLKVGKLPLGFLQELLKKYAYIKAKNVIVGPEIGVDATILKFGKKYLVAKTDPITFTASHIGWYSVVINSNDIACMGAVPKWYLGTLLLPENKTTKIQVEKIFRDIRNACDRFNITLCGGHCEITHRIDRPILIGFMLGSIEKCKFISSRGAKVGDDIILTKGIAIEGISVIAREKENELVKIYGRKKVKRLKNYIYNPGISVLKEALLARKFANSMHDPTEGGIATGLLELTLASDKGMLVYYEKIPMFKECLLLCKKYNLNPLGLIASGSLLITTSSNNTEKLIRIYNKHKISCSIIGKIMHKKYGIKLIKNCKLTNLPEFKRDEITKIF